MDLLRWIGQLFGSQGSQTGERELRRSASETELDELNRIGEGLDASTPDNTQTALAQAGSTLYHVSYASYQQLSRAAGYTYQQLTEVDYGYYANVGRNALATAAIATGNALNSAFQAVESGSKSVIDHTRKPHYDNFNFNDLVKKDGDDDCGFELLCTICFESTKNRVLMPCGHTFCNRCVASFSDCPNCRSEINGTMRIFI